MMRRFGCSCWALALSWCVLFPGSSTAAPAVEAQFFDELGRRAYAERRFEQALESFLLVQSVAPSPSALYNIALCAELAGKRELAFTQYHEYLTGEDSDLERRSGAQARLQRLESELALLVVSSAPPGARIYVDRREWGEHGVTPRVIAVAPGQHDVLLELPGHRASVSKATAEVGERRDVSAALQPLLGRLLVDVRPPGAALELRRDGVLTPVQGQQGAFELPVGEYTVLATAPGHVAQSARQLVREGEPAQLSIELHALPQPSGRLLVASGKVPADVWLDGQRVAVTPAMLPEVSAGAHLVQVRSGTRSAERTVRIVEGRSTFVELPAADGPR